MEIDANDILYTNKFVKLPETKEVPSEFNEEFRKYYKEEMEKSKVEKIKQKSQNLSIKDFQLEDDTDDSNLLNTNKFTTNAETNQLDNSQFKRYKREVKTYVNIDSRDRDKIPYPKPNYFKIYLGKTFYNVKNIRLASIEFPNTNAVINSSNNKIYWINEEDITEDRIDNLTGTYPVYEVSLRIGSYIINTLQSEISNQLANIKRKNGIGNPHYFVVTMDNDTDIVKFISLDLTQLANNPISTIQNLTTINLSAPNHGFKIGEKVEIYLTGVKPLAGITSSTLNGLHTATVLQEGSSGLLQFEINVIASENAIGGGNTVKLGKKTPFQLYFGEYHDTVAPNIGFPMENSSQRLVTNIKSVENYILAEISTTLDTPTQFYNTFDYISQTCQFTGTGQSSLDGVRQIVKIIDSNTFLVQINSRLSASSFTGTVEVAGLTLDIAQAKNNDLDTILVKTFTDHRYTNLDINRTLTFFNTTTTPLLDGDSNIYSVLSSTEIVFPGYVLQNISISDENVGDGGYIPQYKPLKTFSHKITDVTPGVMTTFTLDSDHQLHVGDRIRFQNIITIPPIIGTNNEYTITSVPAPNILSIDFETTSFDNNNINNGTAIVNSPLIEVRFPGHKFNEIINIESIDTNIVEIQMKFEHNLTIETGSTRKIRITGSNCVPSIDGSYEITESNIISDDVFTIPFVGAVINGDTGILGLSQDFTLYGCEEIDDIKREELNDVKFKVRHIPDKNTFLFVSNSVASSGGEGGGSSIYINSFIHGFNGEQDNTKNNLLNRSINLEGENYSFLCCPQLATMMNTGDVKNIFARILLDESPGHMVFSFLSNPKTFDTVPLDKLNELEFSVVNYDNTLYEFNDLDYSFVLEITEVIDTTDSFNISSKRGIVDTS